MHLQPSSRQGELIALARRLACERFAPSADSMPMSPTVRERHEKLRAAKFREVVEDGAFYGQPHSEPVEQGETDTKLGVGGRRFGTTARKVDGGYVVNGRKFFVSLAGCAPYYAT